MTKSQMDGNQINAVVSGQTPETPVVSKKSGHLYEKRLILKYIDAEGKVRAEDTSPRSLAREQGVSCGRCGHAGDTIRQGLNGLTVVCASFLL